MVQSTKCNKVLNDTKGNMVMFDTKWQENRNSSPLLCVLQFLIKGSIYLHVKFSGGFIKTPFQRIMRGSHEYNLL